MDTNYLAELLFPQITGTPEDMEKQYPPRNLPEGAKVTRFAPSPTGFVHFGGLFPSTVGERLAHLSDGVFYLRIEDTDAKREVEGAAEGLIKTLATYGIEFDEGAILDENGNISDHGAYGPYRQSQRATIYQTYAKQLVREGKAYPCFTTEEELDELQQVNKKEEIKKQTEENAPLFETMKTALDGKVTKVVLSSRLKSHPVCLSTDGGLSLEMEKVLNAMPNGQKVTA